MLVYVWKNSSLFECSTSWRGISWQRAQDECCFDCALQRRKWIDCNLSFPEWAGCKPAWRSGVD